MVTAVVENYEPKGEYIQFNELNTYIVGDKNAKIAILYVYDAFGHTPRTIQGADIIAETIPALVIMPDFFRGQAASMDMFPPDTPAKQEFVKNFLCGVADIPNARPLVIAAAGSIKEKYPSVQKLGGIGFCWGGKLLAVTSGEGTSFNATIQCHPGRLAKVDAEKIVIPHCVYASDGEDAEVVAEYKVVLGEHPDERVKQKSVVEHWKGCFHGWMGGKAKLEETFLKGEYERGYGQACQWFQDVLQ